MFLARRGCSKRTLSTIRLFIETHSSFLVAFICCSTLIYTLCTGQWLLPLLNYRSISDSISKKILSTISPAGNFVVPDRPLRILTIWDTGVQLCDTVLTLLGLDLLTLPVGGNRLAAYILELQRRGPNPRSMFPAVRHTIRYPSLEFTTFYPRSSPFQAKTAVGRTCRLGTSTWGKGKVLGQHVI